MRERCATVRKQCPPHQWAKLSDHTWDSDCAMYAVRRCENCKAREHAVLKAEVLAATPRTLWHLADAAWTAV